MIKRKIFAKIWEKINSHEILLLNGPRQVGKTTLMKIIKEKLINQKNIKENEIFWFDLEKSDDLLLWSSQDKILSFLPINDTNKRYYIFLDEFHLAQNIGSTLKVIHDHHPNFKLIITGSATWYLNIKESMAGRKRIFPIWPLSFEEYLDQEKNRKIKTFYESTREEPLNNNSASIDLVNNALLEFLTYGGYPAAAASEDKSEKTAIISEIINSYILRDIQIYNYAANTLQIKKILLLLADRVGSLLDVNNLALNSGLGRVAMINRLDLLKNTFILNLVRPYFTNKTKELVKNPKLYLVDSGIRNSLMNNFSLQPQTKYFGQTVENFVYTELIKQDKAVRRIFFWRTKTGQEVDIIIQQSGRLIPIEIKSGIEDGLTDGLRAFIRQYQPRDAYILNWTINKDMAFEKTTVHFRPIWFNDF